MPERNSNEATTTAVLKKRNEKKSLFQYFTLQHPANIDKIGKSFFALRTKEKRAKAK